MMHTEAELELIDAPSSANSAFPSIQINDGQVFRIPSGSKLSFGTVLIGKGGLLIIEGPTKAWTEITIHGDLLLLGKLIFQGFISSGNASELYSTIASDGSSL